MSDAARRNPIRHPGLTVLVDPATTRRLHCRFYDACLDQAEAEGWPGFSCAECGGFEPLPPAGEARDHRGLLELLAELDLSGANLAKAA